MAMNSPGDRPSLRLVDTGVAAVPRARAVGVAIGPRRSALVAATSAGVASAAARASAARGVEAENIAAARLSALDPRWMLAVRVSHAVATVDTSGNGPRGASRLGFLAPEHRRRLVAEGARLGLRPFDTNLVIAIVQDAARSGDDPLGDEARARLALVRGLDGGPGAEGLAGESGPRQAGGLRIGSNHIAAAMVLAGVWAYLLVCWVLGR
jgi:hypothetical protein